LNHTTSLDKYNESTHNGEWVKARAFSYFPYPINELHGKNICIIGYGAIGKQVAKLADAFGMKIYIATRTKPKDCPYPLVTVDEAFRLADYLTVHCPLTEQTKGLINAERLKTMKKTAYVINTARGAVADEYALREALDKHIISGAACDVLTVEPMREDDPLIGADNITLTPHIAWASYEARVRLISLVASNLKAYQNGLPQNTVK
jgi:glycerate dehydrogenase